MHFTKTLASVAALSMTAYAAVPVASVQLQSWEQCDIGFPALGEPKFTADVAVTPLTCDKTTLNRDWSINNWSFKAHLDTKDAQLCRGVVIWNNEGCTGKPVHFLPFDHHSPIAEGQCLPDTLEPGYVSFKLACDEFPIDV
ncbi:unnamed protein product [Penicillium salamii]|uniref:Uncharacterized protein n=1 Tax=Penicillium salamii TaxID=1612424 RepID=A0A9W4JRZ2_9EURO|nr:unnamed protein product [Penicillium salamii]CAG8027196.1 unnamed protein product [Penicillium salamii]CAG8056408.1 unnamed protein product [Penicillium salamii]CAG8133737.1 unnamed protein product [Penicillium salamii]CAG8176174.1 unnamed protein product [Penicillium salamii]